MNCGEIFGISNVNQAPLEVRSNPSALEVTVALILNKGSSPNNIMAIRDIVGVGNDESKKYDISVTIMRNADLFEVGAEIVELKDEDQIWMKQTDSVYRFESRPMRELKYVRVTKTPGGYEPWRE
ncbi:MAG TPA: hypothetical protein VJH20_04665 [Candidatus Nanoarchaeia archaeon]|nr:hypothetical protein [Candidatus Nanoarchaeia archaeon]